MLNKIVKFTVNPDYQAQFEATLVANQQGTALESGNVEMKLFTDNN